jgi:PIN domain nuclease of toxin-antitoxin system
MSFMALSPGCDCRGDVFRVAPAAAARSGLPPRGTGWRAAQALHAGADRSVADRQAAGELRRRTRDAGLSLGDRACRALAMQRGAAPVTADRAWSSLAGGTLRIALIR